LAATGPSGARNRGASPLLPKVKPEGNHPGLATERSESGKPLGLHKRSAAQCGRLGIPLAGASGRSPLERVFAVVIRHEGRSCGQDTGPLEG
jgi:hypothetical protein